MQSALQERKATQIWAVILLLILSQILCIKNINNWECCEFLKSLEIQSRLPQLEEPAPLVWCANYNEIFHYTEVGIYKLPTRI